MTTLRSISLFLMFLWLPVIANAQEIYINEILASNGSGIEDEDGDTTPWIELYNAGSTTINLNQYGLSDDFSRPFRWAMPSVSIAPGEFMVIFASGKDRSNPDENLHTNFRISSAGEEVLLTSPMGEIIDFIPPTTLRTDVSFGRQPDGSNELYYFEQPTPGSSNNDSEGYQEILSPPEYSLQGGFYTGNRNLELHSSEPNVEIRYTLDGSEPDENSPLYTDPIQLENRTHLPNNLSTIPTVISGGVPLVGYEWKEPQGNVFKGTVVRARVFREGSKPSPVETHSYFVDTQGASRYHLPVISIVTDSLHLFDYETGIYIPGKIHDNEGDGDHQIGNYDQRGMNWERPASFELYENGQRVHAQNIGIRLHGGGSRAVPMKSLRLYARNEYGDNRFNYRIFPDLPYESYNRLILRNSGQDFFGRSTMFRDGFMQTLVQDLNFDTQAYRPAIVFINGEYWGIHNIRERYDSDYLERVYGVDPDNLDILEHNMIVSEGDTNHYSHLMEYVQEHSPAEAHHYAYIQTLMDVDNYLDYITAQVFIRNVDWPGNNLDYFRLRVPFNDAAPPGHDGRWRWMLVDTDAGFGLLNPFRVESFDMMRHMTNDTYDRWPNPLWSTILIRRLFENETFRNQFINRSADYMNSIFHPDQVIPLINEFETNLEPVIEEHILRWGQIESKERWHYNVNRLRDFARNRPAYSYQHIVDYFDLGGLYDLKLDVSGLRKGRVQVNRLLIDEDFKGQKRQSLYPWTGVYFQDVPVEITAKPYQGYRFSHWEGNINESVRQNERIVITASNDVSLKAVFAHDVQAGQPTPEPHVLRDANYHFNYWPQDAEAGTYPAGMIFYYMNEDDPEVDANIAGEINGAYNLTSRTRINGLGYDGFAFINTSNPDGNPGYPGRRLGAAVLALDTQGMRNLRLNWRGGTVEPNSRIYHIRLQYRVNGEGAFKDVTDEFGDVVEYHRNSEAGHSTVFENIELPEVLDNKSYVELLWRYYYTGKQELDDSGARAKLRVSDIFITGENFSKYEDEEIQEFKVLSNYPNPFNQTTVLHFLLPEDALVSVSVYDVNGRLVRRLRDNIRMPAGYHSIRMNAGGLAGGMYIYRIETPEWSGHGKMMLIK